MATFNSAHHETGGVVLFNGELILLFCDNVHLTLSQTSQSETGRLYLTTHRMVFTSKSMKSSLKSFSAPFFSMHDLSLEQPIFGANYIKGKVNDASTNNPVTFKLKFTSGGAIEYGQALQNAARATRSMASQNPWQPPPAYTPSASAYYQAPPNIYQPAYNVGFVLPTDVFNQPPPAGFVYTSEAPPPYPGLGGQKPGVTPNSGNVYPSMGSTASYPTAGPPSYPASGPPSYPAGDPPSYPSGGPSGYPTANQQPGFAPNLMGFGEVNSQAGYPPQGPSYPVNSGPSYPSNSSNNGVPPAYPGASQPAYPSLNDSNQHASAPPLPEKTPI
ncbi:hypothetical protein RDWZM_000163 [Blomia tropicalis]|uniref:GRAM domain-containing protein n=1 Tax=Blomia tropicalis TaxID=40697 RepID=A0A9Q0RMQ3_BLOTA|nr:hypothetical protein RDWZM_000163 [Blomia tropicalis]